MGSAWKMVALCFFTKGANLVLFSVLKLGPALETS